MTINKNPNKPIEGGWSADGQTFIHFGMGYRLKKDLAQVCIGPVDQDGESVKAPETPPAIVEEAKDLVQNSPEVSLVVSPSFAPSKKHPGGRPRKENGEISRWTIQRRKKEEQGILL